ncbi:MAG TPA: sigma 54-interacting transcriptional regulator [Spirochaetota bacterium]|nr:sigma 54-interacting transcriptional regulator [Spirochaetota bacterium]HPC39590.1 sigma 54-interacting transcriptional regulator [Spirochaetota bacterium]HPL17744.1 sigma 54-interacting transcriptional regulator [Spirochaetota bacterium]HQF09485.1 sigma 54-interacting transcriptional regulator [Spirochaetota bacterium]HQH98168.1 sigma 54-interacting transcriptional regulator [Spirochaetota bacterium]
MNNSGEKNIILNSIADGVFTVDMDFRITSMNRAAEAILGIEEKDAVGRLCFEIFHANICEHSCALKETLDTGNNIINKTIYIVNSGGERVPISVSTALLKNGKGDVIGGVETFRDITAIETLRKEIESSYTFEDIVSKNKVMRELFGILPDIATSDSSVLIEGSSGTGKELIARAIHSLSNRKTKPLVVINCAAVPDNLLESELFGYKAGAFTDAKKDKPGKIALAEGGTLFLDEIGEISPAIQVKLLRFIQEREYEPLGGVSTVKSNVRIIAATNKILTEEVRGGNFREDLYYRINVINIRLPALRERKEDIPFLIKHFIHKFNVLKGKNIEGVSDDVMNILMNHDYPGNIRELENIIEHAFVLCREPYIRQLHLPNHFKNIVTPLHDNLTLEEMERIYILKALEKNSWNRKNTAKDLGIDTTTLWRKIKNLKIAKE